MPAILYKPAISGADLAGQILNIVKSVINGTAGRPKLDVEFGL